MAYNLVPEFPGLSVQLSPNSEGRMVISGIKLERPAVTAEALRSIPLSRIEQAANGSNMSAADLPPLQRDRQTDPIAFSRLVAEHYRAWSQQVPNPVAAMAAAAGVKPPTVHTWVRESRLRGLLPPARRGKA